MKFTKEKLHAIDLRLCELKEQNPIDANTIGIGIGIHDSIYGATVTDCDGVICSVEDLPRFIEELTMLKQAIEEETGLML